MATKKTYRDNAQKGAVPKRSQQKTAIDDEDHLTKRSKLSGELMDQTQDPEATPHERVRKEHNKG
jgi:hypothetical protein